MTTNDNLSFVKARGLVLAPMSENEEAFLNSKRVGAVLEFPKPKEVRNPFFHRKFFALLNLGFDYWEPTGGTLSPTERKLLEGFAHYLGEQGGKFDVFESLANHYMDAVALRRAHITAEKSFEAYRKWVAIEAGFFDVTVLPNGIIRKELRALPLPVWMIVSFGSCIRRLSRLSGTIFCTVTSGTSRRWMWRLTNCWGSHEYSKAKGVQVSPMA